MSLFKNFDYKKTFSNMSGFHKVFSFVSNIISLHSYKDKGQISCYMGGNHLATWEFSVSNEIKINFICLLCKQRYTGVSEAHIRKYGVRYQYLRLLIMTHVPCSPCQFIIKARENELLKFRNNLYLYCETGWLGTKRYLCIF